MARIVSKRGKRVNTSHPPPAALYTSQKNLQLRIESPIAAQKVLNLQEKGGVLKLVFRRPHLDKTLLAIFCHLLRIVDIVHEARQCRR